MLFKTSTVNSIDHLTQNNPHMTMLQMYSWLVTYSNWTCDSLKNWGANTQPSHTQWPFSPINSCTLSHWPTVQNKILKELNLHGLCKYNRTQQAYFYENSNKIVKCTYIFIFPKQSTCYTTTPDTHQWHRVMLMK